MRLTFVVSNYAPSIGGAQTLVQRVAEGLVSDHGHQVQVLTTDALVAPGARNSGKIENREETINGVLVRRLPVARRTHSLVRTSRRLARRLGFLRSGKPSALATGPLGLRFWLAVLQSGRSSDVVIGASSPFLTLLAAYLATRRGRAGYMSIPLLHLAVEDPPDWVVKTLRAADGVTALTSFERDWLVDHGIDTDRVAVIPPGCDPVGYSDITSSEARLRLGIPDRPTVGYIGRLAAQKGVDTFLRAANEVWDIHPHATVLLAGRSVGWEGYEQQVGELRSVAGDRLIVLDGFSEEERPDVFAACDVVVFPSRQESFGMITIEAWCARRPVVAADIGSVRCVIRQGEDGELVAVDDSAALASSVAQLLGDPDRRARYGAAGRRRAETEFAWDKIVDDWNSFLLTSVAARRRTSQARPVDSIRPTHDRLEA